MISTFAFCQSDDEYLSKCHYPTVLVVSDQKSSGTGFIVKSLKYNDNLYLNIVFSCEHILTADSIEINSIEYQDKWYTKNQTKNKAIELAKDKDDDISILAYLSNKKMNEVLLDWDHTPDLHENVFSIGFGLSEPARYAEGKITGISESIQKLENYRTSIFIVPGDSGGPLFHKNKVIGIVQGIKKFDIEGKSYAANSISLFKSIKLFKKLLNQNKEKLDFIFDDKKTKPSIIIDYLEMSDLLGN